MSEQNTIIIFCNIAWMENYQGITEGDVPVNGGKYVSENKFGHEIFNFMQEFDGKFYGYVQPTGTLKLARVGARKRSDKISPIIVVWTATQPGVGRVIVGWYKNATLFADEQPPLKSTLRQRNGQKFGYNAIARIATLLPLSERNFYFERGKGNFGQSNIWYADSTNGQRVSRKVLTFIDAFEKKHKVLVQYPRHAPEGEKEGGTGRNQDPEMRLRVEEAAMKACYRYFASKGYKVKDVSRMKLGWDLEAVKGSESLLLEAKGVSREKIKFELTPNEYRQAFENKSRYCFCILPSALTRGTKLSVFTYVQKRKNWINQLGHSLSLVERTGAIGSSRA